MDVPTKIAEQLEDKGSDRTTVPPQVSVTEEPLTSSKQNSSLLLKHEDMQASGVSLTQTTVRASSEHEVVQYSVTESLGESTTDSLNRSPSPVLERSSNLVLSRPPNLKLNKSPNPGLNTHIAPSSAPPTDTSDVTKLKLSVESLNELRTENEMSLSADRPSLEPQFQIALPISKSHEALQLQHSDLSSSLSIDSNANVTSSDEVVNLAKKKDGTVSKLKQQSNSMSTSLPELTEKHKQISKVINAESSMSLQSTECEIGMATDQTHSVSSVLSDSSSALSSALKALPDPQDSLLEMKATEEDQSGTTEIHLEPSELTPRKKRPIVETLPNKKESKKPEKKKRNFFKGLTGRGKKKEHLKEHPPGQARVSFTIYQAHYTLFM